MNIQINIAEDEIKGAIDRAIQRAIQHQVEQIFRTEYGHSAYRDLMNGLTDRALEEVPKYLEDEKKRIVDRAAEKLAKGLRISNTEIITALLAIAESEEKK